MFNSFYSKIIKKRRIDDDTTQGKEVYIDDEGNIWQKSIYSQSTAPTGVVVGRMDKDGNIYV